jgi:diguanylate cyclase (GGDEF)-like protein
VPLRIGAYDYLGIPLALTDGSRVGTLCIVSRQGGSAAGSDFSLLVHTLARLLASELEREHSERSLLRRAHTLVEVNAELSVHAENDPLTGLPNRRAFDRTLSTRWLESVGTDTAASLGIFDIDDFRSINDTLGHKTGDLVLCAAANAFSHACRSGDTISRIGGDEFAVILAGCPDQRGCGEFAQRANERLIEELRDSGVQVTLSQGFAQLADFPSAEAAFEAADRAMYGKKRGHRLV